MPLGAITIYRTDLERILAEIESYFDEPVVPIIRARENDQIVVRNAVEYLARGELPEKLKELTIAAEVPSDHGLKKIVNLSLSDDLDSKITVSSPDELWTEAVGQRLNSYMQQFTSTFTGFLRRHGLNINSFFLVLLLIALPEFELFDRIVLVILALIVMVIIARSQKLVPFARIYLDPDKVRKPYSKEIPSMILGGVTAAAGAAITALPTVSEWIAKGLEAAAKFFAP